MASLRIRNVGRPVNKGVQFKHSGLLLFQLSYLQHIQLWGLGRETVRKVVAIKSGVIKISMGRKKAHTTYSVPESVAQRIHTGLLHS